MANCPHCQKQIAADFGMVTCSGCGTIFMLDLDGNLAVSSVESSPHEPHECESQDLPPEGILTNGDLEEEILEENNLGDDMGENDQYEGQYSEDFNAESAPEFEFEPGPGPEPVLESELEFGYEELQNQAEHLTPLFEEPELESSSDLGEIAAYGNTEVSAGREGFLLFDLTIKGIDSKDLYEDLKMELSDPRFVLDVGGLLGSICLGELTIRRLSSVKASLLVSRLKRYPFDLTWEQHAITQSHKGRASHP